MLTDQKKNKLLDLITRFMDDEFDNQTLSGLTPEEFTYCLTQFYYMGFSNEIVPFCEKFIEDNGQNTRISA